MNARQYLHKVARIVYKTNRSVRTAEVYSSGDPKRISRLIGRRLSYKLFAHVMNRIWR